MSISFLNYISYYKYRILPLKLKLKQQNLHISGPNISFRETFLFLELLYLPNISKVRPFHSQQDTERLIHALIVCRLYYCYALQLI